MMEESLLVIGSVALGTIVAAEIAAYGWHRFVAHEDYIPPVRKTHRDHHQADLLDEAHSDFIWIIILLVIFIVILLVLFKFGWLSLTLLIIIIIILVALFTWNWYIHAAYHQPGHWLEEYDWFLRDRQIHLVHHDDANFNYGIASHFCDKVMGTYMEPEYTDLKLPEI